MKLALAIIILLLFPLMVSVNGNSLRPQSAGMRNIAIQIMVSPTTYDAFVSWITPFTANFHNFTIIVELDNGNYDWFLHNSTRVNFLTSIGEVIPDISADFIIQFTPATRLDYLNFTIDQWINSSIGSPPQGIFMYQPDTYFINAAEQRGIKYVMGYCFDQYQVDYMTMRGGWQLPYYASSINALMPENSTSGGVVVLPWLTWDWIDSFTVSHLYETEPAFFGGVTTANGANNVIALMDKTLDSTLPFGYVTNGFSFDWYYSLDQSYNFGLLNMESTIITHFVSNSSYQILSGGNFTNWFKNTYSSTPTYHINYTSPFSGETIEWYYDNESRIARYNGTVVSYVDYTRQQPDKYLTDVATVNSSMPISNTNSIDNSLQFSVDALGGGKYGAPVVSNGISYSGMLSDFPEYYHLQSSTSSPKLPTTTPTPSPTPTPTPESLRIGLIVLFGVCLALIVAGIIAVHKHRVGVIKKTETFR